MHARQPYPPAVERADASGASRRRGDRQGRETPCSCAAAIGSSSRTPSRRSGDGAAREQRCGRAKSRATPPRQIAFSKPGGGTPRRRPNHERRATAGWKAAVELKPCTADVPHRYNRPHLEQGGGPDWRARANASISATCAAPRRSHLRELPSLDGLGRDRVGGFSMPRAAEETQFHDAALRSSIALKAVSVSSSATTSARGSVTRACLRRAPRAAIRLRLASLWRVRRHQDPEGSTVTSAKKCA